MKLLFLASFGSGPITYGGSEKTITNLANWIAENTDYEVILASFDGDNKPYPISDKVIFDSISFPHRNKIQVHYTIYRNTKEIIHKFKPDFVISFMIQPLFYMLLTRYKKTKFLYSERNDPLLDYGGIAIKMRDYVLGKADSIVFQTKDARKIFDRKIQEKSIVIHNPIYVDYNKYTPAKKTDDRIVAVGRLNLQKNYPLMINAFEIISKEFPELVLEIYGEGVLKPELIRQVNDLGLEKKVLFMGTYPNILDKIYGARLFVMTSLYEGMPNALMEAMSLGITVVSSDCPCGGPKELIEDRINGYLFKNNDLDSLVCTLREALNSDNSMMNEKERQICYTHSKDMIFNKWYELIEHSL